MCTAQLSVTRADLNRSLPRPKGEGATESKTRKHQVCNKDSQITSLDLRGKVLRDVPEDVRRQMLKFQEPLNFR